MSRVFEYITLKRPNIFIIENVKGIVTVDKGSAAEFVKAQVARCGMYDVYDKVINSNEQQVPQHRPRWYCVGIRRDCVTSDKFEWPAEQPMDDLSDYLTQAEPDEK